MLTKFYSILKNTSTWFQVDQVNTFACIIIVKTEDTGSGVLTVVTTETWRLVNSRNMDASMNV